MSRLTDLLLSAIDHAFPPAMPVLGPRQFDDEVYGVWTREDRASACTWAYAGVQLVVDAIDREGRLPHLLSWCTHVVQYPHASVHVGVVSRPLHEFFLLTGTVAQNSDDQALLDLHKSKKDWLNGIGFRERLGYLIVRVKLDDASGIHRDSLEHLADLAKGIASAGGGYRPLTQAEVMRIDADPECGIPFSDFVLFDDNAAEYPALTHVLGVADHAGVATYQATLDIIPETHGYPHLTPRASANLRIFNPEFGRRSLERELHRHGISMGEVRRRHLHFPLPRETARWPKLSQKNLLALAPLVKDSTGFFKPELGMPLKSMTGEYRPFAPFSSEYGANTLLLGELDTGAHDVACEVVAAHLSSGSPACIIDDTGTFNHLSDVFHGNIVRVGLDYPQGLDPFRTFDIEDDSIVVTWLLALTGAHPDGPGQFFVESVLHRLCRDYPRSEHCLANIARLLFEIPDPRAHEMGHALSPYVSGQYASLFQGEPRTVPANRLTVFDVSSLKDSPALPHVVQALMQCLRQLYLANASNSRLKKLFIVNQGSGLAVQRDHLLSWMHRAKKHQFGVVLISHPREAEPGSALHLLDFRFAHTIATSLTAAARDSLRDTSVADEVLWQMGHAALNGETTRSMRGNIRLLLRHDGRDHVFELRLDPASRDLYASSRSKALANTDPRAVGQVPANNQSAAASL